jgi:hypothetical protein
MQWYAGSPHQIIDATARSEALRFVDAYYRYNQIKMVVED